MSPSTPNRLFSDEVSGLEVDHQHIDWTVEVRSRLSDTSLIAVNEQRCSNSNPGRSAALNRGRAEYGGGHEVAGRITIEIEGDASTVIAFLAVARAWISGARFMGGQSRLTPMPLAWRSVGLAADAPAGDLARDDPHVHIPRTARPGPDVGLLLQAAHVRLAGHPGRAPGHQDAPALAQRLI